MVANGYARAYRSNAILTASPGQLVLMMYDGALKAIAIARAGLEQEEPRFDPNRISTINQQLLKAQAILAELQDGLNMEAGDGEFSKLMYRLYDYYNRRLHEANMRKDVAPVIEVERLLTDIREAWAQMLAQNGGTGPTTEPVRGVA